MITPHEAERMCEIIDEVYLSSKDNAMHWVLNRLLSELLIQSREIDRLNDWVTALYTSASLSQQIGPR